MSLAGRAKLVLASAVLALPALAAAAPVDSCYADCSDGLAAENDRGPAAGEPAPDFTVHLFEPATGRTKPRSLDTLLEERPLILAFGSYT